MSAHVRLRTYDNSWYTPGRSFLWQVLWLFFGLPLFRTPWLPFSGLRVALLRAFGAKIGTGVVIHSEVSVKYPWHLRVGDDCWVGERVWIDNLTTVQLGSDVCLSQDCYICTGNHNWSDPAFELIVQGVELGNASWAAARSVLLPGVVLGEGAIAGAGSVITRSVPPWEIHTGNPAAFVRRRDIQSKADARINK